MWTFPSFESVRQDVRYACGRCGVHPRSVWSPSPCWRSGLRATPRCSAWWTRSGCGRCRMPNPDRLVDSLGQRDAREARAARRVVPGFHRLAGAGDDFEDMAAVDETRMTLSGSGDATRILVETVSASYFPLLRVNAAAGRTFAADEDVVPQKVAVVVLSDAFWRRQLGARSADRRSRACARRAPLHGHRHHAAGLPRSSAIGPTSGSRSSMSNTAEGWPSAVAADFRCSPGSNQGIACAGPGGTRRDLAPPRTGVPADERKTWRRSEPARRGVARRDPSGIARADDRRRIRAADRVRKRRQSAARPVRGAAARNRGPHRDRRRVGPRLLPPAGYRELRADGHRAMLRARRSRPPLFA